MKELQTKQKNSKNESMSQDSPYLLKNMLNAMIDPICYKDINGIYLGVNEIFARQIAGLPEEEIVGQTLLEVARKIAQRFPERSIVNGRFLLEYVEEWDRDDIELLKRGGTITHEYEGICADSIKRVFLINKSTFSSENGEILGLVTVLQDVTERNEVQKTLQEKEEEFSFFLEQTGYLAYDYDIKAGTGSIEGAVEEITGYSPQEFQDVSFEVWSEHIHPEDQERMVKKAVEVHKEGGSHKFEFRFRKKDGTYFYTEDNIFCLLDENGKPYRIRGVMKDITERKQAQQRIQKSEERYRSFIQNFKGIAFQTDEKFIPLFLHGAVKEITGYAEEEFMSGLLWKDIIDPQDLPVIFEEEKKIREVPNVCNIEVEYKIRNRNGKTKWVHETCQKIPGKDGKPETYQGVIYDITERKQAEESLAKIETARKKEIHHRIKNNLQVISSLMDLQAEKFKSKGIVKDSEVLEAFRENQDRVISIALIHEELHEGRGTDMLNFSAYLERLIENLFQTYKLGDADIKLRMDLEENLCYNMDTAVPLGLIVNELVSNSLKYAFSGRKTGEIQIKLCREENTGNEEEKDIKCGNKDSKSMRFILTVSDNGVGIPKTIDLYNSDTLGLQLVSILVDQLEGEIKLERNGGTEFTIGINVAERF